MLEIVAVTDNDRFSFRKASLREASPTPTNPPNPTSRDRSSVVVRVA